MDKKTIIVHFRVSQFEFEILKTLARSEKDNLSGFLRKLLRNRATKYGIKNPEGRISS